MGGTEGSEASQGGGEAPSLDGELAELHGLLADRYDAEAFLSEVESVRDDFFGLLDGAAAGLYVAVREGRLDPDDQDRFLPGTEVTFHAEVRSVNGPRSFDRSNGATGRILDAELSVLDEDRTIRLVLWDDDADGHADLAAGETVHLKEAYVRDGRYGPEVHLGRRGVLERAAGPDGAGAADKKEPVTPPTADDGAPVRDLAGTLRRLAPTRTFARDGGGTGFVATAKIEVTDGGDGGTDEDIHEVTLWDEAVRAVQGVAPGDPIRLEGLVERDGALHATAAAQVRTSDGAGGAGGTSGPGTGPTRLDSFVD